MSTRRQSLKDYLALRQAMGVKMHDAPPLLSPFVDFLARQGQPFIPTAWAERWATHPWHADWLTNLKSCLLHAASWNSKAKRVWQ
jgi:hypothetical protein